MTNGSSSGGELTPSPAPSNGSLNPQSSLTSPSPVNL